MKRSIIILMAAVALVATACTTDGSTPGAQRGNGNGPTGGEGIFAAGSVVQPFDSCSDFLTYVKAHAIERVGPYGLGSDGGFFPIAFAEESFDAMTTVAASRGADGESFSGTNVQVAGIDEPDLVKTDGDRIFVVAQGKVYWVDTTTDTPKIVASHQLDGWGQQLFLSGDTLLVMTSGGGGYQEGLIDRAASSEAVQWQSPRSVLTELDVSEIGTMTVVRTLTLDGAILSSRLTGETARVVVRSGPIGFAWVYPEGSGIKAERAATKANKQLIEDSTLENWVPWYVLEDLEAGTTSDGPLLSCDQVGHPDEFSGLNMLTVLSVDLHGGIAPDGGIGLLADGQTVYASASNLYVATSPWMWWPQARLDDGVDHVTTQIHMFDISDPKTATYTASGEVEGALHSQWALDEYEGILRVVVTDETPWWSGNGVPETSVLTMETLGDRLVQIGSVSGLGKNERVYSVRFIADKGYVVTFRQVDPLYVVDLSDPKDPTVAGELKINGYSAYLHPIGEDLLLGVGQDATDEGRTLGTQVSVFDVSDPSDPRRLSRLTFKDAYSEAEWDHHAFLWWADRDMAVLPMQRWHWDESNGNDDNFSGAVVVSATAQRVSQVGEIEHPSNSEPECEQCERWSEPIVRTLVIGDTLYSVSPFGVMASDLDTLETKHWLEF